MNEIEKHIASKSSEKQSSLNDNQRINTSTREVSLDTAGNKVGYIFDKGETRLIDQFVRAMSRRAWVGSENLALYSKRSSRILSGTEMTVGPSSYGLKNKLKSLAWVKVWSGRGYLLGAFYDPKTRPINSTTVKLYVCSDGMLRCQRYYPIFRPNQSFAFGYGTLPDKKIVLSKYKFSFGFFEDNDVKERKNFSELSLGELLENYLDLFVVDK